MELLTELFKPGVVGAAFVRTTFVGTGVVYNFLSVVFRNLFFVTFLV